ncbi:hypothetical protein ACHQM5_025211 [Ranunculus cassubicifolius]
MSSNTSKSTNSISKSSKRTLDSTNTKNNKFLKSNSNQKTLGMAWGSNSLSSSSNKSSSRRSNFPDFTSYMAVKNQKLHDQFDADASNSSLNNSCNSGNKPLFSGISIFVDGFTVPSSQELRGYMLKYGGRFENYFSRTRVTHIICSNLPDSKIKNFRSFSRGLPVVKPTWVLDSVAANKVLNWVPYQLDQLVETVKQPKLSAFFTPKINHEVAKTPAKCMIPEEGSSQKSASSLETPSREAGESVQQTPELDREISVLAEEKSLDVIMKEATSVGEKKSEQMMPEPTSSNLNGGEGFKSSPCKSSASANERLSTHDKKTSSTPQFAPNSNRSHSTMGDPNFVENYFKNSRLHFIGTWRSRYRKRFPSLPSGIKCASSTVDASTVPQGSAVIHVDMDCFFVSVIIRNRPELEDKPVAVCHSNNPKGTAEISSANYPARDYGVRAGMFVRDAKALCPHLVILPYNFEAYEVVADQFYDILHKHCNKVQAVSCDEAFLDLTDQEDKDVESIASIIRQEIYEATGCTASAGIAGNLLMARLATRTAKPNGQFIIPPEKVEEFLEELPIKALPGIGHVLEEKLKMIQILTCGQLQKISKESLQKEFGLRTGNMLWSYSRGIDSRSVGAVQETKSVGAEVNWGVRFNTLQDSQLFLVKLCNEVSLRLQGCGVQGRTITLKLKKKRKDAGEPTKYMGCGDCENLSHSMTIPIATDDVDVLQRISKQLFAYFQLDVKEIRGVGLQVSRLENADMASQGNERNTLRSWLSSASANREKLVDSSGEKMDREALLLDGNSVKIPRNSTGLSHQGHTNQSRGEAAPSRESTLPSINDLDMGVIQSLPPEIFSEMNEMYGGRLSKLLEKNEDTEYKRNDSVSNSSIRGRKGDRSKGKEPVCSGEIYGQKTSTKNKGEHCRPQEHQCASTSVAGSLNSNMTRVSEDHVDLMPTSLSQVDISVLQELPEELKGDILELLPAHRSSEYSDSYDVKSPHDKLQVKNLKDDVEIEASVSTCSLWVGHPPDWVDKFEVSNHLILNLLADSYYKSGSTGLLSSVLQGIISALPLFSDPTNDAEDDEISSLYDLLQQYIDLKIKSDMEEIYICFRLLRRFTMKSGIFSQVCERVLPYLQVSFGENYGGHLNV